MVSHRSEAVKLLLMAGAVPTIANFTPILEAAGNGFYAYVIAHAHAHAHVHTTYFPNAPKQLSKMQDIPFSHRSA